MLSKRSGGMTPQQNFENKKFENIGITLPPPTPGEDQRLYDPILSGTERIFSVPDGTGARSGVLEQYIKEFKGNRVCARI